MCLILVTALQQSRGQGISTDARHEVAPPSSPATPCVLQLHSYHEVAALYDLSVGIITFLVQPKIYVDHCRGVIYDFLFTVYDAKCPCNTQDYVIYQF